MNLNNLFKRLKGTWHFNRSIYRPIEKTSLGQVTGTVILSEMGKHTLHYYESGILTTIQGQRLNIRQEYLYKHCPIENKIEKYFCEPTKPSRLFYRLHFRTDGSENHLKADACHLCKKDKYIAEYVFFNRDTLSRFELMYRVAGPNKASNAITQFNRTVSSLKN